MQPFPVRQGFRLWAFAFALAAFIASGPETGESWAAPGDRKFVTLRGRVADAAGAPLGDVRVEASGTREGIALTSDDGRFSLYLDLGSLQQLRYSPVFLSVKARRAGQRIRVSGGAPELALELKLGEEGGGPVLQARSNFGIIADALLDALAPPGDRTAVIQVRFVAEPGAERDSSAVLPELPRSVPVAEPWVMAVAPPPLPIPTRSRDETPQPGRDVPTAPAVRQRTDAPPAEPATRAKPGRVKRATERRKDEERVVEARPRPPVRPVLAPAPVRLTRADSLRLAREAEQRATIAAVQAQRDSVWKVQRALSLARKAVTDSVRAVREAAGASVRRARFGLPPLRKPNPVAVKAPSVPKPVAVKQESKPEPPETRKEQRREWKRAARDEKRAAKLRAEDEKQAREQAAKDQKRAAREAAPTAVKAPPPAAPAEVAPATTARVEPRAAATAPAHKPSGSPASRAGSSPPAPTIELPAATSGLRRIEPRADALGLSGTDAGERARLEADTCSCVVRGTVEMEFHRLLTSPMRVEVSIRELPALRDTIELFMGSPRAFEMARVPCGRWSLTVRPLSERPFGVTSPEEVGPFDCRQRALRQVRIVIAPTRTTR